MQGLAIQSLSEQFGLNTWLVKSWFLQGAFFDEKSGVKFFEDNKQMNYKRGLIKYNVFRRLYFYSLRGLLDILFGKSING